MSEADISRAEIYKMWCNGWAYIPYQDLGKYEQSYRKVYNIV